MQEDLKYFEASEDADEEFYAGGGQFRRHGLEHFPQLWCENGTYSVYGQVRPPQNTLEYCQGRDQATIASLSSMFLLLPLMHAKSFGPCCIRAVLCPLALVSHFMPDNEAQLLQCRIPTAARGCRQSCS